MRVFVSRPLWSAFAVIVMLVTLPKTSFTQHCKESCDTDHCDNYLCYSDTISGVRKYRAFSSSNKLPFVQTTHASTAWCTVSELVGGTHHVLGEKYWVFECLGSNVCSGETNAGLAVFCSDFDDAPVSPLGRTRDECNDDGGGEFSE